MSDGAMSAIIVYPGLVAQNELCHHRSTKLSLTCVNKIFGMVWE